MKRMQGRKYVIFATVALAILMLSINSNIVATALPLIQDSLGSDLSWTAWIITIYQLTVMAVMPLMGRISDEWGRRRIFMACAAVFTFSSLLCSLAPDIKWLIVFRFMQALGGGGFIPTSMGIIADQFADKREEAIGITTSLFPIGGVFGPVLGGYLLESFSWKAVFLVNLPAGVLVVAIAYLLMDKDTESARARIDVLGALLFSASILCFMYFMTLLGGEQGPAAANINYYYLLPVLALVLLFAFVIREKNVETPIIDLALLQNRPFVIMNILNVIYGACVWGVSAFIPYYGQVVFGLPTLASGTMLTARAFGMMGMSVVSSMLLKRTRYRAPMIIGFLLTALSFIGLNPYFSPPAIMGHTVTDYWWLVIVLFVSGIGIGMVTPASNNANIDLMPHKISEISGLRGMLRQAGGVIGTSTIVLLLSRFADKAQGFKVIFIGMSIILAIITPLIKLVPNGPDQASH